MALCLYRHIYSGLSQHSSPQYSCVYTGLVTTRHWADSGEHYSTYFCIPIDTVLLFGFSICSEVCKGTFTMATVL